MSRNNRAGKLLYHMTPMENLRSILQTGVLLSRWALKAQGADFEDVASGQILTKRSALDLEAYVPFHFMLKTPFDYRVRWEHPDCAMAIIAVSRNMAEESAWKIVPRHPLSRVGETQVLEWGEGVEAVDWAQMDKYPRDYEQDDDCRLTCMAEALSPDPVFLSDFHSITVQNANDREKLQGMATELRIQLPCYLNVSPRWFP